MADEVSILIADDHPIFRRGLRQVIEAETQYRVVAEAENGAAALEQVRLLKPDVAVLDVNMPQMSGFDVARELRNERKPVAIVFLTMYKDEDVFNAALDVGVKGYVLKDSAITDIVGCVRAVAAGQPYISPQLSAYLLNRSQRAASLEKAIPGLNNLTPTERRILKLIAEYKTSKEIAEELHIHYRTVDNHRTNISQKLGLQGSHALLKFAVEHKSQIA